jgi:deoxyribodipyrimidine photo-lyase
LTFGIHWFRRDLRIAGNPALRRQFELHQGRVLGIFCFDKKFLSRPDFSSRRFAFFLQTLQSLQQQMQAMGGQLLVVDNLPLNFFEQLLTELKTRGLNFPKNISWCEDYEPFAIERDDLITHLFQQHGIEVISAQDHLLVHPQEMRKDDGSPYRVFTPFFKKWLIQLDQKADKLKKEQKAGIQLLNNLAKGKIPSDVFNLKWSDLLKPLPWRDNLIEFQKINDKKVDIIIPPAGPAAIINSLNIFEKKIQDYLNLRDFPDQQATSKLSIYFKNGSLSTAQVVCFYDLIKYKNQPKSGAFTFLKEIAWREFYYNILYFFPSVESSPFQFSCNKLVYDNNKKHFERWCKGETGFPIVDAGMRELNSTGLMHNRMRMIVASFLTKDLLIDWRWGERYFMQQLLDGDLAANNGGWQWAASTGTDAQPYFRIFNPWTQGLKFDPQGIYIKKYVTELQGLESSLLHEPILKHERYPPPIVEHKIQRELAIAAFKRLR